MFHLIIQCYGQLKLINFKIYSTTWLRFYGKIIFNYFYQRAL